MFDDEEMQKTGTAHHQMIRESGCCFIYTKTKTKNLLSQYTRQSIIIHTSVNMSEVVVLGPRSAAFARPYSY